MVALDEYFHHKGTKTRSRCCTTSISPGFQNRPLLIDHCSLIFEQGADAYGNTLIFTAPDTTGNWWGDAAVQSSYGANEIIYCGYRFDPETQLYYVRNRTYNPVLGRWIQRDPIGYSGGINLYGYVESGPAGMVDAWGGCPSGYTRMSPAEIIAYFRSRGGAIGGRRLTVQSISRQYPPGGTIALPSELKGTSIFTVVPKWTGVGCWHFVGLCVKISLPDIRTSSDGSRAGPWKFISVDPVSSFLNLNHGYSFWRRWVRRYYHSARRVDVLREYVRGTEVNDYGNHWAPGPAEKKYIYGGSANFASRHINMERTIENGTGDAFSIGEGNTFMTPPGDGAAASGGYNNPSPPADDVPPESNRGGAFDCGVP